MKKQEMIDKNPEIKSTKLEKILKNIKGAMGLKKENPDVIQDDIDTFSTPIRRQYKKEQNLPFDERSKIEICLPKYSGIYLLGPAGHHADEAYEHLKKSLINYNGKVELSVESNDEKFKNKILEEFNILKNKVIYRLKIEEMLQQNNGARKQETKYTQK